MLWLAFGLAGLSACDAVYRNRNGEFNAGPVDPVNFPPEYLGTSGGNRLKSGAGKFVASRTYVNGTAANQFYFSLPSTQLKASAGKTLNGDGTTVVVALPATPRAYVFDPGAEKANCVAEEGYVFDPVRDDLDYGAQGDIFTSLPDMSYAAGAPPPYVAGTGEASWKYAPVIAQVPVTSNGEGCQDIKSERTLVQSETVTVPLLPLQTGQKYQLGETDGTFLARAIIDPAAAVFDFTGKAPSTGVGLQQWGWYGQFMLAYIDGGTIPTVADNAGTTWFKPQRVYYPRTVQGTDGKVGAGALGKGYDVVAYRRGEAGYSPVCEVMTYDTTDATTGLPLKAANLPKSAAEIEDTYKTTLKAPVKNGALSPAGDRFVYCLQLE